MFKGNNVLLATYEYFCTTGNKNFKYVFLSRNILYYNVIIYFYIIIIL